MIAPYPELHGHGFPVFWTLHDDPEPVYGWSPNLCEIAPQLDHIKAVLNRACLNDIVALNRRLQGVDRVAVGPPNDSGAKGCTTLAKAI